VQSLFGRCLASGSGIEELMDDLGHALAEGGEHVLMLGGGNPAHLPAVEAVWDRRMREIVADPVQLRRVLAVYDPPRGNAGFSKALAGMLRQEYGWDIGPENLAVTSGSQLAFFYLFNLFGGLPGDGKPGPVRKILFPVMPEYIGYAQQAAVPGMFAATLPKITKTGPHGFKYHVDFSALALDETIGAICVSRPTNPSGNVLEDEEVRHLSKLAGERGIPLIIDNAYGLPFPGILFRETQPIWAEHHVFVLSLSKLGLPGTRTAVVVARPETAQAVASLTAVTGLANGNFGQAITKPLLQDGTLLDLARNHIRPYYEERMKAARAAAAEYFPASSGYALHETEGAMFLWLWLEGSPVPAVEFYRRLKARGVLVVPGDHFFFGLGAEAEDWAHRRECLRISFAMGEETVQRGLEIIGEELRRVFG
jgi:valine--pyruvate aminotransferase